MGKIIKSGIEYAGGGGGDVDKQYVDTQDAAILQSAKDYTDTQVSSIEVPTVVQTIGQSTTDVMSQKAATDMVYTGGTKQNIAIGIAPTVNNLSGSNIVIGEGAKSYGSRDVAIGYGAKASKEEGFTSGGGIAIGSESYSSNSSSLSVGVRAVTKGYSNGTGSNVAIGIDAVADPANASDGYGVVYSVALGACSKPTRRGEINIGTGGRNMGFVDNNSATDYRVIGGVHDGVDDHDAATVGQLNAAIPAVVQTMGQSTDDVMSQKAITDMVFDDNSEYKVHIGGEKPTGGNYYVSIGQTHQTPGDLTNSVRIGNSSFVERNGVAVGNGAVTNTVSKDGAVAIGALAVAAANRTTVIGANATTQGNVPNSVAIGYNSVVEERDAVSVGGGTNSVKTPQTRKIVNVTDGVKNTDAATVAQGNKLMTVAPTTTDEGVLGQLWTDTTAMHTYQCTAIDTTDPDNPVYTWTQRW